MIYYVQRGDTLYSIAQRFNTTVQAILDANVICNPNIIFIGQILFIPQTTTPLPRAGGGPYYIVQPGDTLWCLARLLNSTPQVLQSINQLQRPNLIYPGMELLIGPSRPNAQEIRQNWITTAEQYCATLNSLQLHGIYYLGTFQWQGLGQQAIPYLLELIQNPCPEVRFYSALSLGRLGIGTDEVIQALTTLANDPGAANSAPAAMARLALRRIALVQSGQGRIHLLTSENRLYSFPNLNAPSVFLPSGAEVIVWKWNIPSPTTETGPLGDLQIYDIVQVVETGQVGFLPRVGYNEITLV